jgi:hypothetical protein
VTKGSNLTRGREVSTFNPQRLLKDSIPREGIHKIAHRSFESTFKTQVSGRTSDTRRTIPSMFGLVESNLMAASNLAWCINHQHNEQCHLNFARALTCGLLVNNAIALTCDAVRTSSSEPASTANVCSLAFHKCCSLGSAGANSSVKSIRCLIPLDSTSTGCAGRVPRNSTFSQRALISQSPNTKTHNSLM